MSVGGPSYVLVPGLGLTDEDWGATVLGLVDAGLDPTEAASVLLPGYGEPVGCGDPVDPEGAAYRLLNRWPPKADHAVLVGHSSSCQVVAHAAALAPDRVAGLVLVGPTTDPRAATWPRLAHRWLATAAHETPRQVPSLVRQYRRTGLRHMARVMNAARDDRIDLTLARVRCPVQVVRGVHDRIAPEDWCARLAPTVTLPTGGHMVPMTDGAPLAMAIEKFRSEGSAR